MQDILSVGEMRMSDAIATSSLVPGMELMRRAGEGIFRAAEWKPPVAVVCGSGNNGGDGYVTAYSITGDTLTEITTIPSADLSYSTSYIYEQSGYIGTRVLRAGLMNDPSNLSYELIILSSECEIISDITISWSDSNGDGQITEDDAFTRDGEITSFAEWFDLTGIS